MRAQKDKLEEGKKKLFGGRRQDKSTSPKKGQAARAGDGVRTHAAEQGAGAQTGPHVCGGVGVGRGPRGAGSVRLQEPGAGPASSPPPALCSRPGSAPPGAAARRFPAALGPPGDSPGAGALGGTKGKMGVPGILQLSRARRATGLTYGYKSDGLEIGRPGFDSRRGHNTTSTTLLPTPRDGHTGLLCVWHSLCPIPKCCMIDKEMGKSLSTSLSLSVSCL